MNRVTVVLLALALLLAHSLAIHQSTTGSLGPPYDIAHVAFRVARNLVHEGSATWLPAGTVVEAYPSPLWVGICYLAERFYASPITVTQVTGFACMLGAIFFVAQFSAKRLVGLVAPVLLAVSGCAAAAGASGTEAPLAMLLVTLAVLAFERGCHNC